MIFILETNTLVTGIKSRFPDSEPRQGKVLLSTYCANLNIRKGNLREKSCWYYTNHENAHVAEDGVSVLLHHEGSHQLNILSTLSRLQVSFIQSLQPTLGQCQPLQQVTGSLTGHHTLEHKYVRTRMIASSEDACLSQPSQVQTLVSHMVPPITTRNDP